MLWAGDAFVGDLDTVGDEDSDGLFIAFSEGAVVPGVLLSPTGDSVGMRATGARDGTDSGVDGWEDVDEGSLAGDVGRKCQSTGVPPAFDGYIVVSAVGIPDADDGDSGSVEGDGSDALEGVGAADSGTTG